MLKGALVLSSTQVGLVYQEVELDGVGCIFYKLTSLSGGHMITLHSQHGIRADEEMFESSQVETPAFISVLVQSEVPGMI